MRQEPIAAGQIFIWSSGDYSSYQIRGVFRALKAIDNPDEWVARFTGQENHRRRALRWLEDTAMFDALLAGGYIEEVDHTEWYT